MLINLIILNKKKKKTELNMTSLGNRENVFDE